MHNSDNVVCAHFWRDGHVAGEVEINQKWDKLIQWHEIVQSHKWYMKHQDESFFVRFVDVRGLYQEKIYRLVDKQEKFAV